MTLEARTLWMSRRAPESQWRRAAIAAIGRVLNAASPELLADDVALLKAIDAVYPFGERKYLPYKMWLLERRLFREACAAPAATPSADEIGVCEVAGDLVQLGRIDEARKLLEQAPNRLGRRCPACGARPGQLCASMPAEDNEKRCTCPERASHDDIAAAPPPGHSCRGCGAESRWLLVPHLARLVGHRDAGPLFGGAP